MGETTTASEAVDRHIMEEGEQAEIAVLTGAEHYQRRAKRKL